MKTPPKTAYIFFTIVFIVMIASNAVLARKVGNLAIEVERLNKAYLEAVDSFRAVSDVLDFLPYPPVSPTEGD